MARRDVSFFPSFPDGFSVVVVVVVVVSLVVVVFVSLSLCTFVLRACVCTVFFPPLSPEDNQDD